MRFALVTAIDFNLPAFNSATEPGVDAKLNWICPAITSVVACAAPLYGTSVILMPAMKSKSSVARCDALPGTEP